MKPELSTSLKFGTYEDFMSSLIHDVVKKNAVLFLGAGVSMIKPTILPSGKQLKEIVFESLIDLPKFNHDRKMIRNNSNYERIIPEVLFSEIHAIIGNEVFKCFNILRNGIPNSLHKLFAYFANEHDTVLLTTNFDLFIDELLEPNKSIYHLHGDLNDSENMYILLSRIGKGINISEWNTLDKRIRKKTLYILGYSGNDKDILEYLNDNNIKRIKWLVRKGEEDNVIRNSDQLKSKSISFHFGDLNFFSRDIFRRSPTFKMSKKIASLQIHASFKPTKEILIDYKNGIDEVQILLCLIQVHYRLGNYKRLIELGRQFLNTKKNFTSVYRYTIIARIAGMMRLIPKGYYSGLKLINSALKEKNVKCHHLYGELLNTKGIILHSRLDSNPSDIRIALNIFKKSLNILRHQYLKIPKSEIANKESAHLLLSMVYNNIGLCYYQKNDFENAEAFFLKSLKIKRKFGHINGQISTISNLCMLACRSEKKSFSYWQKQANFLMKKYDAYFRIVSLMKDIGLIMIEKGKVTDGIAKLNEAFSITEKHIPDFVIKNELAKYIKKYSNKIQ